MGRDFYERNDNMTLNISNITDCFKKLSGISDEDLYKHGDFITYGKAMAERLITKEPSDCEIPLCEYFAGCLANYSYVCALLSTPKKYVTQNGLRSSAVADSSLLSAARLLKDQAFMSVYHLTEDDGFVFKGVGE